MPIEPVKEKLYAFIKDRQDHGRYTSLGGLRAFSDAHNIPRQDMGDALQLLKQDGKVNVSSSLGWYVKG